MMRVWGKLIKKGKITADYTAGDDHEDWPFMKRVDACMDEIIHALDLAQPIWLPRNRSDMEHFGGTKFTQDHFIEAFPYQYFEIEIIEMDDDDEEKE